MLDIQGYKKQTYVKNVSVALLFVVAGIVFMKYAFFLSQKQEDGGDALVQQVPETFITTSTDVEVIAPVSATGTIQEIYEGSVSLAGAGLYAGGDITVPSPIPLVSLPELAGNLPSDADFSASRMLVKDVDSGIVLFSKKGYEQWPLASMTKLMSAIVLLEKGIDFSEDVSVTTSAVSDSHIHSGEVYSVEELWELMLVASSNKAVYTLAEYAYGDADTFADEMNKKAKELGLSDTFFADPSGLDPMNVSTASDVAILLEEALTHPEIMNALQEDEVILAGSARKTWNTNWLLLSWIPKKSEQVIAGKTGYIPLSKYNFTARFNTSDNRPVDVVIMGAKDHESRFTEARDVLHMVMNAYSWE